MFVAECYGRHSDPGSSRSDNKLVWPRFVECVLEFVASRACTLSRQQLQALQYKKVPARLANPDEQRLLRFMGSALARINGKRHQVCEI
uniref:Uncharacterized protein n=1 Tax=Peronospora matthiolae TaxID=2874970 RepID=A0AAV1TM54_9STRA